MRRGTDVEALRRGRPGGTRIAGCPSVFIWRGRRYQVVDVIGRWRIEDVGGPTAATASTGVSKPRAAPVGFLPRPPARRLAHGTPVGLSEAATLGP